MQSRWRWTYLALLLGVAVCVHGQRRAQETPPLVIVTDTLPRAVPRQEYRLVLQAKGGVPPYRWSIDSGTLPAGVGLNARTGVISGVPTETGEFSVVIALTDSARPPHIVDRDLRLAAVAPLTVEWKEYPRVDADQISGSVEVENGTKDQFDQTVIIVAVNEYHKAFTLGYQHFTLEPDRGKIEIPFGSTLPRGQYVVHADAIAEVESKRRIHRGRLQTPKALAVTAP